MPRVTVIGKNSFLAQALQRHEATSSWRFLDHDTALSDIFWMEDTSTLINCAFHPELRSGPYAPIKDIDLLLSGFIQNKPDIHYMMLSSRAVYGPAPRNHILHEDLEPEPETAYGLNKWLSEQALTEMLPPERLTILRMGNIFGDEAGRHTFFGQMLGSLKEKGVIDFDIAPDAVRDFLPADQWADYLVTIASNPKAGLYNIGAGFGVDIETLAGWVIEGFGAGEITYSARSYKGQFILDTERARTAYTLAVYNKDNLRADALKIGQNL